MKKAILLFSVIIGLAYSSKAQNSGTIIYERTINLHKNLSEDQQMMKSMIPETTSSDFRFTFNKSKGVYEEIPSKKSTGIIISSEGDGGKTWFDFDRNVFRKYITVDGELYHNNGPIVALENIKPTGKSKKILGFPCEEFKTSEGQFSIWVTKHLPKYITPLAPMFYNGAVLAIEGDKVSYIAKSFSENIDPKKLIPDSSTEITKEQFLDLQEEKMDALKQKL
ncbi:GLPGLI family protein [Zhouia amylolytica]|uniref:GLPGLI family protein n=2 Tax=Zhouia amylolytica TaxID=376730 RepID=W2UPN5_9FLAO|nr:hypothetical protein [Zhouia amylolytica]ETN95252.1 hypothetical protein P278_09740 [Zhouia amylolytica AD3]SFT14474.1 GLPGLI family protein [Zhouia amylolytica]